MRLVLLLLILGMGAPPATPRDAFDELFEKAQPQLTAFQTVAARFVETTTSSLLKEPVVDRGALVAARPSKLRMDYDGPGGRTLVLDEHRLVLDWPAQHEHMMRDITRAQQRVQKYFVDKDPAALRSHFEIRAFRDPHVAGTYQIEMVPRRTQIREGLSRLQIWLDDRTYFMRQLRMVFPNGDSKTFTLENVRMNAPVDPKLFATGDGKR